MFFAEVNLLDIVIVLLYLFATAFLGYLGYRGTKTTTDYLVAGRKAHPFVMSLSYGATFISTSAIVGFGGVAGLFGMSLLWLTFCNIFIGIFIAFIFLGEPTRRIGHRLDAHTFPELLGRRYQSTFIQVFAGLVIAQFMPLYGAAVLIGGTEFVTTFFGMDYNAALMIFAVIVAAYVFFGGLKGVMYTDALQGVIMFVGMAILIIFTYAKVGGVIGGHQMLSDLKDLTPPTLTAIGHQGWAAMPQFGFGETKYNLWWIVISTITMGVGIGVLAQPQLAVRFMTVKSKRELNRAVGIGGIFIFAMTGVAFVTGALSNAYFALHGPLFQGRVLKMVDAGKKHTFLQVMKKSPSGEWADAIKETSKDGKPLTNYVAAVKTDAVGKWLPVAKATNELGVVREGVVVPALLDKDQPFLAETVGPNQLAQGRSISIVYAKGNSDQIIPTYINMAMPKWFGLVFMLTLLAAAMSTLSSQFHTLGTAAGRDVFERLFGGKTDGGSNRTIYIVRTAILLGLVLAVAFGYYAKKEQAVVSIIARATAIFFGLCASTFLPAFVGGLYCRRITKAGAIASMLVGFFASTFWLAFVKVPECTVIGLVGKSIFTSAPNWPVVDPLFIGLPLSLLTAVVVSAFSAKSDPNHLDLCFPKTNSNSAKS
ncbi:MAG: sodium:solute symporter family protein [Verrucomicrobia bacterium]|jgi:SSS family solute:Na+ symporter|nr:sodium:solute symporter family protein [Verrucomicrobiota bacterium]